MTLNDFRARVRAFGRWILDSVDADDDTVFFILDGQIPSGKNAITITRNGKRFPNKRFKDWREDAMAQMLPQIISHREPYKTGVEMRVTYWSADYRRRDLPGMLDALFHLLEKARVLEDDYLVRSLLWDTAGMDRKGSVSVELRPLDVDPLGK